MKKICSLLSVMLFTLSISAQNYDKHLHNAYSALEAGNIEKAEVYYNIYKKMTGKIDLDFQALIEDAGVNAWTKSCHIIKVNDSISLAVQHVDKQQIPVSYDVASIKAKASRLGDFTDWRLPYESELKLILPNISFHGKDAYYWFYSCKVTISGTKNKVAFETECFNYQAMNNISYKVVETYYQRKTTQGWRVVDSETDGNKDTCHNYLIVRRFNHKVNGKKY